MLYLFTVLAFTILLHVFSMGLKKTQTDQGFPMRRLQFYILPKFQKIPIKLKKIRSVRGVGIMRYFSVFLLETNVSLQNTSYSVLNDNIPNTIS